MSGRRIQAVDIDPIKKLVFSFPSLWTSFSKTLDVTQISQHSRNEAEHLHNFPFSLNLWVWRKGLQLTITILDHKVRIALQIYWSDSSLQTIQRAMVPEDPNYLGFAQDLEIEMIRQPDGLAFDWVARWTIQFSIVFVIDILQKNFFIWTSFRKFIWFVNWTLKDLHSNHWLNPKSTIVWLLNRKQG